MHPLVFSEVYSLLLNQDLLSTYFAPRAVLGSQDGDEQGKAAVSKRTHSAGTDGHRVTDTGRTLALWEGINVSTGKFHSTPQESNIRKEFQPFSHFTQVRSHLSG